MPDHRLRSATRRWISGISLACAAVVASPLMPLIPTRAAQATELRRDSVVRAVAEAKVSIVNIHGRKTVRGEAHDAKQVNGMGTGIIIDPRGYIVTNYHVVEGVSQIQVSLHDERDVVAKLIAHDPKTDLAVIKVDLKEELRPIKFGTSCDLMEAEGVIAIGNAYGYPHTTTTGRISALNRTVQVSDDQKYFNLIQTDAAINPGNSGGPLINIDGETIGINVAVRVGAQGIGFAIPIDDALEVTARLMNVEKLEQSSHGIVGKTIITPERRTFSVTSVKKDSPAEKAGLQAGDIVSTVNGRKIERALDIELAFLGQHTGEELAITAVRKDSPLSSTLTMVAITRSGRPGLNERVWGTLGIKLSPMNDSDFKQLNSRYQGGLRVLDVRKSSPAWQQGIRTGDVLVGMHIWETTSLENIAYILEREEVTKNEPVIFYIIRGTETLQGQIRLAERTRP
ncbi:MAG: trypsin-like peptidase domain-containing protein [Planctomycetales bacterium]|nr:trypsin-like peptidase domain-containing protein [Planctomycetales bacterium]